MHGLLPFRRYFDLSGHSSICERLAGSSATADTIHAAAGTPGPTLAAAPQERGATK